MDNLYISNKGLYENDDLMKCYYGYLGIDEETIEILMKQRQVRQVEVFFKTYLEENKELHKTKPWEMAKAILKSEAIA